MRYHGLAVAGAILVGTILPVGGFAEVPRSATGAVQSQLDRDLSQASRDQREVIEFKMLLSAMDDALLRNHIETYYAINGRLREAMERELEQSRERLAEVTAQINQSRRERRAREMKATMGGTSNDFFQLQDEGNDTTEHEFDLTAAKKRRDEMHRLIDRFDALQFGLDEGGERAYVRNSALLDRFLRVMRAELEATEAELAANGHDRE
jgi:hypothetical protein